MEKKNNENSDNHEFSECPKQFSRLDTLLAHQRDVHGSKSDRERVRCKTCKKSFSSRQKLRRHEATHTDKPQYQCSVCSKEFKRSDNLKRHERSHGNVEMRCEDERCKKVFTTFLAYERHQHTHTDEEYIAPENVPVCKPCSRNKYNSYKSPFESSHQIVVMDDKNNQRGHQCTHCLKIFRHCKEFELHYSRHHEFHHPIPGKLGTYFIMHMHGHRKIGVRCDSCPKLFGNQQDCDRHQLSQHQFDSQMEDVTFAPTCDDKECPPHQLVYVKGLLHHQCTICLTVSEYSLRVSRFACFSFKKHHRDHHIAMDLPVQRGFQCQRCKLLFSTREDRENHSSSVCSNAMSSTTRTTYTTYTTYTLTATGWTPRTVGDISWTGTSWRPRAAGDVSRQHEMSLDSWKLKHSVKQQYINWFATELGIVNNNNNYRHLNSKTSSSSVASSCVASSSVASSPQHKRCGTTTTSTSTASCSSGDDDDDKNKNNNNDK